MSTNEDITENEEFNPEQSNESTDDISLEESSDAHAIPSAHAAASAEDDGSAMEEDDRDVPPMGSDDRPIIIN